MNLELRGIGVDIASRPIIDGVVARIRSGQTVGVIGPNGSGKSTLLKCLYRALKPSRGAIHIEGRDVRTSTLREHARTLAAFVQEERSELDFTVAEMVALGRFARADTDGAHATDVCQAAMRATDVHGLAQRSMLTLSGGERQRVLVARALAQETPILVLDEPTNHLDLSNQLALLAHLKGSPTTVIMAIHDLNLAAASCDHLLVMHGGRLCAEGSPQAILTPDLVHDIYGVRPHVVTHPTSGVPQLIFTMPAPPQPEGNR